MRHSALLCFKGDHKWKFIDASTKNEKIACSVCSKKASAEKDFKDCFQQVLLPQIIKIIVETKHAREKARKKAKRKA